MVSMSPEDQRIVLEFFCAFARFEYALKRSTKFLTGGKERRRAEPDWKTFAREIGAAYPSLDGEDFKQARAYILGKPPKVQIVVNNELDWDPSVRRADQTEISVLLECVKTMRNNLFHGGKFPGLLVDGSERDPQLLVSGAVVLRSVATLDEKVRAGFDLNPETH